MEVTFFPPTFIPISDTERVPIARVCKITTETVNDKVIYTILVAWFDNLGRHFMVDSDSKAGKEIAAMERPPILLTSSILHGQRERGSSDGL